MIKNSTPTVKSIRELLDQWTVSDVIKEVRNISLQDDILAITCCVHRVGDIFPACSLSDIDIASLISKEDYDLANTIRTYYQQKLLLSSLKGRKLTAFRTDLSRLVNDSFYKNSKEKFVYPEDMQGLAYRLPEFYAYDIEIEKMFGGQYSEVKHGSRYDYTGELVFVSKLENKQRGKSLGSQEFWFKNKHGEMVVIATAKNNKLIPFFERAIAKENINVTADLILKYKDNIQYYVAIDWSIS